MRLRFLILALAIVAAGLPGRAPSALAPPPTPKAFRSELPRRGRLLHAGERSYPPGHVMRMCASYPPGGGVCQQYQCTTCQPDGRWANFEPC